MTLESIKYERGILEVLDQLQLPHKTQYVSVEGVDDGFSVIKTMKVRGAPAIAIVGALSVAVELTKNGYIMENGDQLKSWLNDKLDYLVSARPTAVNLRNARKALLELVHDLIADECDVEEIIEDVIEAAELMMIEDQEICRKIGCHGAGAILAQSKGCNVSVLHHCNTGSLATAGYGTALGVIRSLFGEKSLDMVYFTETRPYNQGARLTAYELLYEKIPSTMICDSMAGWLMKTRKVDAVVVGADSVPANGDVANKIGTYTLAVLAQHHNVPFYVAVPSNTLEFAHETGEHVTIEERPHHEMTHLHGIPITPSGVECWNPAFDITPAQLITGGIITENGVFPAMRLKEAVDNNWILPEKHNIELEI